VQTAAQPGDIRRWRTDPEGQFLERKSAWDRAGTRPRQRPAADIARDIVETLSAMANADGGELLVGIEDDGVLSGVPHREDRIRFLEHAPADPNYTDPPLPARPLRLQTDDGLLLLRFEVSVSPVVHRLANGRYLLRVRDANVPWPADQIAALKATKAQGLFERTCPPGAAFDDLDLDLIDQLASRRNSVGDPTRLLGDYDLAEVAGGQLVPNMAALLLFGKKPERWHPRCGLDFVRWDGAERLHGRDLNVTKRIPVRGPLITLIQAAFRAIKPFIRERQTLHDLFFRERLEYPTFVWQEAIVNAVAHRDYSLRGGRIEVHTFDDRMEVRSPGLPPAPVTIEALNRAEHVHLSRNPLIVRVLTDFGYMQELGEGIPRMFAEMEREGFYPPRFQDVGGVTFAVTLQNQPIYDPETLQWLAGFADLGLSGDQKRLLAWARSHGDCFTSREYQKLCDLDIYGASSSIKELIRKDAARQIKKGGRVYEVLDRRQAAELPPEFQKMLGVLTRNGALANRDIRDVLGVDRQTALRFARKWVERGLLVREGEKRGAVYRRP